VARRKGWRHVFLPRPPDHYARSLEEAVELTGGMGRFDECQFLGELGEIQSGCDVLFEEDAMDALFKGYYWIRPWFLRGTRVPMPGVNAFSRDGIEDQILQRGFKSMFWAKPWLLFRQPWRSRYREIIHATLGEQIRDSQAEDPYNIVEHVGGLANLGRTLSGVQCVRPYLEYRSYSLDNDLLELCARTPVRHRMGGRILRGALRLLDPALYAIPYANTGVRFDTPEPIAWAFQMAGEARLVLLKKLGLRRGTCTNESWADRAEVMRGPQFRAILERTFNDPECFEPSLFDIGRLREVFDEHMSHRRHYKNMLLCLLTFGRWFKKHGPQAVEP
jgi:hypothetical protein